MAKQLAKTTKPSGEADIGRLAALVSSAYEDADRDRRRNDRAIQLMAEELNERHRALEQREAQLAAQNLLFDAALNNMSQGLCMYDAELRIVVTNQRLSDLFGLDSDVVKPGTNFVDMIKLSIEAGNAPNLTAAQLCETYLRSDLALQTFDRELPGGRVISVAQRPMADGGRVATFEDVTDRRRTEAQIAHMARYDALTDLPNRASFRERLISAVKRATHTGASFAVFVIDLDRFKDVNDVFGHSAGDALLCEVSRRLLAASDGAFLARLGGDEFTVIMSDGVRASSAATLARRLQDAVAGEIEVEGHRVQTGLSIGVAIFPTDGADVTTLLGNADAALYRAKADARGTIRFFEADMDLRLRERRALQHELESAIAHDELILHYQPQALMDGDIIGFEALVRWRHPTRGLVPPDAFIPIAEESGLIIPLSEWVMREACREAASWQRPLQIAVNLSAVQFRHGDLPGLVHSILLETGLSPRRLELEITETVLIDDFSRTVSILRRLKSLGVRIAMDDFGTGYSSLSYLQSFPFDKIKIDRGFVSNMEHNIQSATIVRAVIGLGRGLKLRVVAEGVESASQMAFLSHEACDEIQGFAIGRPCPIENYAEAVGCPAPPPMRSAAAD